jgi:RNA polymerase sigma factor (sigma-70 family)
MRMGWPVRRGARDVPTEQIRPQSRNGLRQGEILSGAATVSIGVRALNLTGRAADAALVEGLASGDEAAAVTFVRRFQSAVYGLALSITRDAGMAEDVSQEVFTRAWRAAATYDVRRASVGTWLLTITRNAAIDAVRVRRPVAVGDELLDALLLGVLGDDAEAAVLTRLEADRVAVRLRALPPEQARAVVLAVVAGCTAAEVGERENIPLGTAKTRLRLGLLKLRAAMVTEGGGQA